MSNDTKKYGKLSQREHILLRPDTYVGSNELSTEELWVYDEEQEKIIKNTIKYNPALLKIFDEALVNASDASVNDKTCDYIKVEYNKEEGYISIENNGDNGIPVEAHHEHKTLVPSMIFGELLTSSNFDDEQERVTGGRNGIGIKLNNIFSSKFIVEIVDIKRKKKFYQEWTNNMEKANKAKVTDIIKNKAYIKVIFYPDFKRFGIENLNNNHYELFYRRVIDIAGISGNRLKVYFNNNLIKANTFKSYIDLYYPNETIYFDESNERWLVGVIYKQDSNNEVISFVNSINTYRGGSHANYVIDNIIKILINDNIKKKEKELKVSPQLLKDNLIFFINSTLINPTFSSQTKDTCTSKIDKFGSKYIPQPAFLKKLAKCGIVEQIIELVKFKESSSLKKTDGKKQVRIKGIPKLDDAIKAGSKDSYKCSLILTEGDSAKAFAISGLSIVGREYFGVVPLKGKLLNVREATPTQLINNEEINSLKQIMGLKHGENYSDDAKFKQLRYGRIIILTDADVDGSHIKGLVMNFIHSLWPSLIKKENFITSLATPIVKAFKGNEILTFYNLTDYELWIEKGYNKNYKIKYYKGLGTSTSQEAKEYFVNIEDKLINYLWAKEENDILLEEENDILLEEENDILEEEENNINLPYKLNNDEDAILLAFDKTRADDRKIWLQNYDKNNVLLYEDKTVSYYKFVHSDLIHFSNDDLSRSIPSIVDGLKPSQRKVLFGAYLRGLDKTEVKVAQLAGFVSDKAAYHHGEASLMGAIIGMAQNFVGSNNINVLKPNGNFGCLSPDTPIILWNGTIKKAEKIIIGDELIGDDGNKRSVIEITEGIDDMYKINIKNKECDSFICNSKHILTLYFKNNNKILWNETSQIYYIEYFNGTEIELFNINEDSYNIIFEKQNEIKNKYNTTEIIDIKLEDYLKLSNYYKKKLFMFYNTNCINWIKKEVPIDPYIFGIWLGNGFTITNTSKTCKKYIDCKFNKSNELLNEYIYNDKETRLQLLAGIIDTNGYIKNKKNKTFYVINQSKLIEFLNILCKSLGFTTSISKNTIRIYSNNLNLIPCKLERKQIKNDLHIINHYVKFNVEYLGKDKFNGWQVDNNERFLLGNYIVTHNSRIRNGKDAASPRYIWTKLEDLSTILFNPADEPVLNNQLEDNEPIEPEYYAPIIPMVLVNGTEGIGTGYSTKIPCYDPKEIIDNLKNKLLKGKNFKDMDPFWYGFEGIIAKVDNHNYEMYGTYQIDNDKLIITELPIGESIDGYKEFLEKLLDPSNVSTTKTKSKVAVKKKETSFLGYLNKSTDTKIHFELEFISDYLETTKDIDKQFRLVKKFSTTNMHLFDVCGTIKKYNNPIEIMNEFYTIRYKIYEKRKQHELDILEYQLKLISFKVKFILLIVEKKLIINNKKKSDIEEELETLQFPKIGKNKDDKEVGTYNYLLSMPIYNLTMEKIEELKNQKNDKETEYEELENTTIETLWINELNKLEKEYDKWLSHRIKTDKGKLSKKIKKNSK